MNNIIIIKFKVSIISILCIVGMMYSCTNLEVQETDSDFVAAVGEGTFDIDPVSALQTNYNDLGTLPDQANTYALYNHTSDEMIPPTRGTDWGDNGVWRTLHAHTWDASHVYVLATWDQINERVFRCNTTLSASGITSAQKAQAKFLRALYMFHIIDLFGQVPFREADERDNVDPIVKSRSEAFDFIEKDLTEAISDLATIGPKAQNHEASKAAARFLLARMYLNKAIYKASNPEGPYTFDNADMQKVIENVNMIEADGFELDPDYFNIFHPTDSDKEGIFHSIQGTPANRINMTTFYNQSDLGGGGWNGFTTLADFYDKFESADQRIGKGPGTRGYTKNPMDFTGANGDGIGYGFLIGLQYTNTGEKFKNDREGNKDLVFTKEVNLSGALPSEGIRVMKYHPSSSTFETNNYILMRYADAHLMRAEAMMRSGDNAGALAEVNELRRMRGASPLSSLNEAAMLDERGLELYWEGVRRIDQIRFGTFIETWHEKTSTESHRVLFPIPIRALSSNPNLEQNPGY